jgi:hypothetical protein
LVQNGPSNATPIAQQRIDGPAVEAASGWVGAGLAAAALLLAFLSAALERRHSGPSRVVAGALPTDQRAASHR